MLLARHGARRRSLRRRHGQPAVATGPGAAASRRQRRAGGPQAEHPRHLRRRHRHLQHQRLQPRPDGLPDAQHRPHRQGRRDVHRLLRRSRAARPAAPSFILGQEPFRTGLLTIGMPGAPHGIAEWIRRIADAAQAARLRHRPVRQEPSRRPGRAPADGAWLRRVLRQPLPPQCRGGARRATTIRRIRKFSGRSTARAACIHRPALGATASRDRGHRPADHEAHGDGGRGIPGRAHGLHRPPAKADKPFFVWFNTTRMHVCTHLKQESMGKTGMGIHADGMVEHDGMSASC